MRVYSTAIENQGSTLDRLALRSGSFRPVPCRVRGLKVARVTWMGELERARFVVCEMAWRWQGAAKCWLQWQLQCSLEHLLGRSIAAGMQG